MSEPQNIYQAFALVMKRVRSVAKRDKNDHGGYVFRGVDAVINAVGPKLREVGVIVVPIVEDSSYGTVEVGRNRTQMGHAQVTVTYRFYGPDGTHIDCRVPGEAMDSGDKAMSKAMSVAFRTALIQALCLPTDEPDPDGATYERSAAKTVEDYRAEALNGNATKQDLERTYREANRAGMLAQLVTDAAGKELRLVDLLIERGKQVPDGLPRNKDRSVSRSKLTDEEKAAAGLMTNAEVRAHGKLERETVANPKKAERLDSSELFDPFATTPPEPNGGGS
ncbi:ERF family protein [Nonomuraea turkmeniaca]|uniref:ERF family protein n=1 Tax=Nonomuraea turkmeniaca TaxID=103838 RepID=UPI001B879A0F|nr:ERF family protein [Nonomuraea turkmeniaca]